MPSPDPIATDRTAGKAYVPMHRNAVGFSDHYRFDSDEHPVELIRTWFSDTGEIVDIQEIPA
jgi:hypothetical protein